MNLLLFVERVGKCLLKFSRCACRVESVEVGSVNKMNIR